MMPFESNKWWIHLYLLSLETSCFIEGLSKYVKHKWTGNKFKIVMYDLEIV